jgi:hypothetical protein
MQAEYVELENDHVSSGDNSEDKYKKAEAQRQAKSDKSKFRAILAYMGLSIPEALNFSSIFLMLHHAADFLFNTPMRFFVFPCAAIYGMTKAGMLWRNFSLKYQDYKAKKKLGMYSGDEEKIALEDLKISFLQSLWETLNGLGTTGAVVTGIVGFFIGATVGMGISITFNFFLAASTAICGAYSVFFAYRAYQTHKDWKALPEAERTKEHPLYKRYQGYIAQMKLNLTFTGIVALLTIGVAVSMVAGFTFIGGIIGVIGCFAAAAYTAYNIYKFVTGPKPEVPKPSEDKKSLHNNTKIHNQLMKQDPTQKPDLSKRPTAFKTANNDVSRSSSNNSTRSLSTSNDQNKDDEQPAPTSAIRLNRSSSYSN